jgi:hypothetical protein
MTVPPIAPHVLAEVLDELPPRLRRRLDAAVPGAADWPVESTTDGVRAELGEDTVLTWVLRDGVLATPADLTCSCLLAPKCLHRAIAVAAADVTAAAAPDAPEPTSTEVVDSAPVTPAELAAAGALTSAAGRILDAGATGAGTVVRAELLRAVHAARIAGLHRPAAIGLRIASALADRAAGREVLAGELTDLLLTCHDLTEGIGDPAPLRGVARREYRPVGAKRLYGLCTETVLTGDGYAGVVSHVVDADGELWNIPAVTPGGAELITQAANGPVAVGESGLTHGALARGGLLLASGTASPDHRLGAGTSVRAVAASGAGWTDEPLARLWRTPLADQVARAFAAADLPDGFRPSGAGLVFLTGTIVGGAESTLRIELPGGPVDLVASGATAADNLALLAGQAGREIRAVARIRTDLPATATALAIAPAEANLPTAWGGRLNVGLDRLQRSHLTAPHTPATVPTPTADWTPGHRLATWVHRVVVGGRSMAAVATADADLAALRRAGLTGAAAVLADLANAARSRHRDTFGRLVEPDASAFPRAWLRAGVHLQAFRAHAAALSWPNPES